MRSFLLVCLFALGMAVSACSMGPTQVAVPNLPQAMPVDPPGGSYMLTANTYAGDALHKMLLLRMSSGGGILTTTFVDMHDFEQTSAFGRVTSQQVGSRLGQYGFRVIEARLAATLTMVPRSGEFMLTRETARLLADTYDAHSVLIGSYSDEGSNIFVSARVVRLADNVIMGAYEYYLPRDGDVARLLAGGNRDGRGGDGVWDRYNRRTPAFASGASRADTPAPRPASAPQAAARPSAPAHDSGPAVPRYVDPNATAAAPVKKTAPAAKAPAAPVARAPVAPVIVPTPSAPAAPVTPIPLEKDAPPPSSIPGGGV
ncbi:conserved exported hypothetical protein [uncultured delta proteobacterium]|uniref:FlgO domain-containing protein n=1 Tax=uncultured delta proteobacterium TaxID=34034 RepID=A0A212IXF7_9DELT|nr:conserved exported hypothetical protein [uncultured delta proteobacterium]